MAQKLDFSRDISTLFTLPGDTDVSVRIFVSVASLKSFYNSLAREHNATIRRNDPTDPQLTNRIQAIHDVLLAVLEYPQQQIPPGQNLSVFLPDPIK